ncbi:hypothetical protein [Tumebacillus flagellatus]|uniref:Uncharacterized protein n=1 Tax=Tumebacillus flagellatus TaxID=1157490 RepID=A0A074LMC7_9BACL|nr:hypothetical protein [Tumebacillus flagellatus]KEO81038.1 hypothetical protein EL26_22935 [Tumebacillus flagellatus]
MTETVLDAIIAALQSSEGLAAIKNYHKFKGMVPGERPTISIACGLIRFKEYDNEQDEATIPIEVLVYLKDINPLRGEELVRALADEVRFALLENPTLGGNVDSTDVTEVVYETNDLEKTERMHYAVVSAESTFFAPRRKPGETPPILQKLLLDLGDEVGEVDYEDEGGTL